MASLNKLLNVASQALSTNQTAIATVGHNLANANTEGYSRQKVILETNLASVSDVGLIGSGVKASSITRLQDKFLGVRLASEMEVFGELEQKSIIFEQVEAVFKEGESFGLSKAINDFFNAWSDLSGNASLSSQRTVLISRAEAMASTFNKMDSDLKRLRNDTNTKIGNTVTDINEITAQIASLNDKIHQTEIGGVNANDLRDSRDKLIKDLSQKIHINFSEDSSNMVNVFTNNGFNLVQGVSSFNLQTSVKTNDPSVDDVLWTDQAGNSRIITSSISSGELAGLIDLRDTKIVNFNNKLGSLAAGIINETNKIHTAGFGLDKSTGINFFSPLSVSVASGSSNTGTASVSGAVADPSSLKRDEYQITMTSSTAFSLTNLTRNAASGTYTFSAGTAVLLPQGLSVTITGSASSGDTFDISVNKDAAKNMQVNSAVLNDINKIAASSSGNRDDGDNAQAISDIDDTAFMGTNSTSSGSFSFTFQDYYFSLLTEVGTGAKQVFDSFSQQEGLVNQIENLKEAVSGVNVDEEMVNIIKFQRAYESAAKIINVVDGMLASIIEVV